MLCGLGLVGLVASGGVLAEATYSRWAWERSEAHGRSESQVRTVEGRPHADDDTGLSDAGRVDGRATVVPTRIVRMAAPSTPTHGQARAPSRQTVLVPSAPPSRPSDPPSVARAISATPRGAPPEIERAELRFEDPPESGAHAVLSVTVRNRSAAPTQPIVLSVPADWFSRFEVIGAVPAVLDDRTQDDGSRQFELPGVPPGVTVPLEIHLVATGDTVSPPAIRVSMKDGLKLGQFQAELTGAPPRPGPVRSIAVPRLRIRSDVVKTRWEPPPFVVGQIDATADLGGGNTVLVGHKGGHAGDVFASLRTVRLGDEVFAASFGPEQRFIISDIRTLPATDVTPMESSDSTRLTLMTCTGIWYPLSNDYSHRLWVIAEPPSIARETLNATVARLQSEAAAASDPREASRLRTDASLARSAVILMDARRSRPR
jgi:LPXTG-site transpeptidase (sortase) family protein